MRSLKYLAPAEFAARLPLPKLEIRLGAHPAFGVLLDGEYIESTTAKSGDAYWVTCTIPSGKKDFTIEVR